MTNQNILGKYLFTYKELIAWTLLIFILTGIPGDVFPVFPDFWDLLKPDKIIHLALFGGLVFFFFKGIARQYNYMVLRSYGTILVVMVSSLIISGLTEYLQWKVFINRSGNYYDLIANMVGCLLGWLAFRLVYRKKIRIPEVL